MPLTEADFESAIEAHLLGAHYQRLDPNSDWDVDKALCPAVLLAYIRDTQPQEWAELEGHYGNAVNESVIAEIIKQIHRFGMLHVLRNGIHDRGVHFQVVQFAPASGLNPEIQDRYARNHMGVMRQVRFDPGTNQTIDTVLLVNGLPVATVELKNAYTGQTAMKAVKQYIKDRKPIPQTPLLQFNERALVHFALDSSEAWMTTRLSGDKTRFLPFNMGNDGRKGNPVNPNGHRTAYLWESVWQKDAWLNILHRFIHLEETEKTDRKGNKRTEKRLIFPRYHQWSCVTRLLEATRAAGAGQTYLNQHSAGSGKTNTIAWAAHQLSALHDGDDEVVFNGVVVISDRRNLDKNLQDTVFGVEHRQGLVTPITGDGEAKSAQLRRELSKGTRIIVSTLQTFLPLVDGQDKALAIGKYAVIVDEAHSSQTGRAAAGVRQALGSEGHQADEDADPIDRIRDVIKRRGPQPNLSFYAFTATPKVRTMELFGQPGPDGKPRPFSLYSMKQAIEEGFIMDVLKGYVTYEEHYKIAKAIEDDPEHDKRRSRSQITRFASLHEGVVDQKVAIIVEHFRAHIQHKIAGEAKAMLVTPSRLRAKRYKQAMDAYITNHGYVGLKTLVAFSGTVTDDGVDFTEAGMNQIPEAQLPYYFDTPEYQILLVAEKYQTGFDQPLLHTMYVDKPLDGVKAVQTLSRINRCHPDKRDTCVVDFVNDRDTIYAAFKPYYDVTTIEKVTDPNRPHQLQLEIAKSGIIHDDDVESFADIFFGAKLDKKTHGRLDALIQPAVERFTNSYLSPNTEKARNQGQELKHAMSAYVRVYEFLTQLYPFTSPSLERFYVYFKMLVPALPALGDSEDDDLTGEIDLEKYRAEKIAEGDIELDDGADSDDLPNPDTGGGPSGRPRPDMAPLSQIVAEFNERFGKDLTENDLAVVEQVEIDAEADDILVQQARNSSPQDFAGKFAERITDLFMDRQGRNDEFFNIIMSDDDAREYIVGHMLNAFMKKYRNEDQMHSMICRPEK